MEQRVTAHQWMMGLQHVRLQMIEQLVAMGGPISVAKLQELATVQTALTAVREEIAEHEVKLGGGGERPIE